MTPEFECKFLTGNAAFEEGGAEEVALILERMAYKVRQGVRGGILRDTYGNAVGAFSLTLPEDESATDCKDD